MGYMTVQFSKRPAKENLQALKSELEAVTEVQEPQAQNFDLTGLALIVGLSANALQVVDILNHWFQRTPKGNEITIRLSDGRTFEFKSNTDPKQFMELVKAAVENMK